MQLKSKGKVKISSFRRLILFYILLFGLTYLQIVIGSSLIIGMISIFTVYLAYRFQRPQFFIENLLFAKQNWFQFLVLFASAIVGLTCFQFFFNWIASLQGLPELHLTWPGISVVLNLSSGVFFYAFIEEVIFRGYIQSELQEKLICSSPKMSVFLVILITSLLFSFLHVIKMGPLCILIIIPSILFSSLRHFTQSIYVPISVHFIFNLYYFLLADPRPF